MLAKLPRHTQTKHTDYIEKRPFMVVFLYNLYIFICVLQNFIDYFDG